MTQFLVGLDVQLVIAALEYRAAVAALAMFLEAEFDRRLRCVEDALSGGRDGTRRRADPPVHQVEVVRGFVHQEAT